MNNERRYKLNGPDVIEYLDSDIIGIVETKACETDNISLNGYTLLSETNRLSISKCIYGGVAILCNTSIFERHCKTVNHAVMSLNQWSKIDVSHKF